MVNNTAGLYVLGYHVVTTWSVQVWRSRHNAGSARMRDEVVARDIPHECETKSWHGIFTALKVRPELSGTARKREPHCCTTPAR